MRSICAVLGLSMSLALAAPAGATRWFVDCARGDDAAAGTSPAGAWASLARAGEQRYEPGDRLLFRRGTICHGVLAPKGSGTAGEPIVATAYGRGPRPVLAGDGARATIALHDVEGWELRRLAVTNTGPPPQPGDKRTAISVRTRSLGVGHHYVVEDVAIRGVNTAPLAPAGSTDLENWSKDTGGIVFASGGPGFEDVRLEGNSLVDVDREGMFLNGPMRGLVVRGNVLRDIGGDGIVTLSSTGALIERNVVDGFNTLGTSFNAGIWGYASTDAVFQFNDVSHGRHGPLDSMAYDVDGSNHRLLFQYNLSHDNDGGFLMLCNDVAPFAAGAPNGGSVIRFNISQNDYSAGRGVIDAPFLCGYENDIAIYNNTVVTRDPRAHVLVENTNGSSLRLVNNILVGPAPHSLIHDRVAAWDANLYQSVSCAPRPADPHAVVGDPLLVAPGSATSRDTASGYRLRKGSPALGAGVPVPGDGGRDYFGNPIPRDRPPNIGAYQGPGVEVPAVATDLPAPALAPGC